MYLSRASLALMAVSLVSALPKSQHKRSLTPEFVNGRYVLEDGTSFANSATYTFESGSLPSGLALGIETVGSRTYTQGNIQFQDDYLVLLVPGGQTVKPYTGGEVWTSFNNIHYASVRTTAILPSAAGVCSGKC